MKRALIIANMLFASVPVFSMQPNHFEQNQNDSVLRATQTNDIQQVRQQVHSYLLQRNDYVLTFLIAYKNRQSWEKNSFEEYVKKGTEEAINYEDAEGEFPLIVAARNNNLDIIKYLIRCGADVDKRTNRGSVWLYAFNNVRISQYLRNDLGMLDEAERIAQRMTPEECQERVEEGIINASVFRSYALVGIEQEVNAVIEAVGRENGEVTQARIVQRRNGNNSAVLSTLVSRNVDLFKSINFVRNIRPFLQVFSFVRNIRPFLQVFSRELAGSYYTAPDYSAVQGYGRTDHGYLALLIASRI